MLVQYQLGVEAASDGFAIAEIRVLAQFRDET